MSDSDTNASSHVTSFSKKEVGTHELIQQVYQHPCLWDRNITAYRNKEAKDKAWHQIYLHFKPDYDSLNHVKKNFVANAITSKWHNVRDSYVKSKKPGIRYKPYLYSEELKFLDATLPHRRRRHEISFDGADEVEPEEPQTWINEVFVDIEENAHNGLAVKKPKIEYELGHTDSPKEVAKEESEESIVSVLVNLIQKEEDEDRAFFKSVTPSVKTLSESSKLEFRIQVLKLLSDLKMKEKKDEKLKRDRTSYVESDSDE